MQYQSHLGFDWNILQQKLILERKMHLSMLYSVLQIIVYFNYLPRNQRLHLCWINYWCNPLLPFALPVPRITQTSYSNAVLIPRHIMLAPSEVKSEIPQNSLEEKNQGFYLVTYRVPLAKNFQGESSIISS